jgi:hypothetical protein
MAEPTITPTPEKQQPVDDLQISVKVADLEQGLSLWKIGLDRLREQDKNARVLEGQKFKALQEIIARDKRLESLPLVAPKDDGHNEFQIISGHHRTRAARMAGLKYVFCLVDESGLPEDKIRAKQLAHNIIQGHDDPQILQEIFNSISDMQAKIDSAVAPEDLLKNIQTVKIDDVQVMFQSQIVSLLFTDKGFSDFKQTLERVAGSSEVYLSDYKYFDEVVTIAREVSKRENIRNVTGIFLKICEIVNNYYEEHPEPKEEKTDGEPKV